MPSHQVRGMMAKGRSASRDCQRQTPQKLEAKLTTFSEYSADADEHWPRRGQKQHALPFGECTAVIIVDTITTFVTNR